MRKSKVLQKIRSGKVARIGCLGSDIAYFPKMAAHFGYDGVWLDAEHRRWSTQALQCQLFNHMRADIDCIVRSPTLEKTGLYRLLEDGATGLMIPHVSTVEMARFLVQAVKFPPLGDRGLDGAGADAEYYIGTPPDYVERANDETCLVVQIETPLAMENLDAIAAVPGIDVLFLGPGDLSLRLGCTPSVDDPVMSQMQKRIATAARSNGKAWGRPAADPQSMRRLIEQGAQFIAYGGDFAALHAFLGARAADLDQALGESRTACADSAAPRDP